MTDQEEKSTRDVYEFKNDVEKENVMQTDSKGKNRLINIFFFISVLCAMCCIATFIYISGRKDNRIYLYEGAATYTVSDKHTDSIAEDVSSGAYTGISAITLPKYYVEKGYDAGVFVAEIDAESPAEYGGVMARDIITDINGEEVTSREKYLNFINECNEGDKLKIHAYRIMGERIVKMQLYVTVGTKENKS